MTGRRPALFPQKNPPFHGTASRWGRWDAAGCCLGEYVGPTPDHGSLYWPRCDLMLSASGCGHLALWAQEHVFPDGGDPFFEEIQQVYDEIGEGLPPDAVRARPGELEDDRAGIEASGLFEVTGVRQYGWERVYRAEEYIELLSTFSDHLTMENWQRERLYGEIRRRLAGRPDRSVRRGWGAVLHIARRRGRTLRGGAGGRGTERWIWLRNSALEPVRWVLSSRSSRACWGSRAPRARRSWAAARYSSDVISSSSRRVPDGIGSMAG